MDTQVGQTISADQFNQAYPVGTTLSKDDFTSKYGGQQKTSGAFVSPVEKTGLYDIPVLGGLLRGATQPFLEGAQTIAQAGGELATAVTGGTKAPSFVGSDFQDTLDKRTQAGGEYWQQGGYSTDPSKSTINPTGQEIAGKGVKQALDVGITAKTLEAIPGLVKTLAKAPKYLSKGGVYKQMENIANKVSGEAGAKTSLNDIYTEAQSEVADRLGSKYTLHKDEINNILRKLIYEKGQTSIDPTQFTAKELLKWRGELSKGAQENWLEKILGSVANPKAPLEAKTSEVLRNVVSQRLKESAPDIKIADKLYGLYSNPLIGQPWTWPLRAAAYGTGVSQLKRISDAVGK